MDNQIITDIKVRIFNTIEDIESMLWDSLLAEDDLFSSYRFIQAVEKSNFYGYKFWYLLCFQKEKLIATTTLFSTHISGDLFTTGKPKYFIRLIRKMYKSFLIFKVLFCGLPVSMGKNNLRIADGVSKSVILYLLSKSMAEIAYAEHIKVLVLKEFNEEEIIEFDELKQFDFHRVYSLPTNELVIEWNSYEDYLCALRHRYRESIARSHKKIDNQEISILVNGKFGKNYSQEIYRLYENVIDNVQFKLERLPRQFFVNVSMYFGEESELIIVRRRNQPIGKILMMYSPDIAFAMFLGINYNFNREYDLYFNMLTQIIKRAIEKKKKKLEFGQSSYQAKGRMGAKAKPLYLYVKHLNKLWNFLIQHVSSLLFPKVEIIPRNVFKNKID